MKAPIVVAALASIWPLQSQAHSFAMVYTPPLPFWMYIGGASLALVASFIIFGLFLRRPQTSDNARPTRHFVLPSRWVLTPLQALNLGLLALCIATGLLGTPSPYGNFNMTLFWIVFALGGLYLTAVIGDLYCLTNPWFSLSTLLGRLWPRAIRGMFTYPAILGVWPALALYVAFIWIELFGGTKPHSLAILLAGYTGMNLAGVVLIGQRAWFQNVEFFSILFRLIGCLAPAQWEDSGRQLHLTITSPAQANASSERITLSLLLFVLFMLSATAFDGLKDSLIWHRTFWVDLYHAGLKDFAGRNPLAAVPKMRQWFEWWNVAWLALSPFLYLGVYWLFIALGRRLAGSARSSKDLAFDFAFSLLPIALVYHVTHYYTLIQTQGVKIIKLASDPFGWGWNLFGTAHWLQRRITPDPTTVWHTQVALIVIGHVASVYLAHRIALRVFPTHRQAVLSQIPMLILMLLFTGFGLWILSLPPARLD